ncbi:unknown protein [Seminavis robusta]|uniref:DDE Tnp4 domain-containing protein n=1 Tax=Seminavis robusta TaxID=568900 RepID=A0A9N8HKD4_9STRA|nr:unknown protein [Seminavis robusta]|eukprot:Sro608_g174820.1 n/a (319) ;mRNA; r:25222-26178
MLVLSPMDVQQRGLKIMKVQRPERKNQKYLQRQFRKHFGSSPLDLAEQWHDLCHWEQEKDNSELYKLCEWENGKLPKTAKMEQGFQGFLAAHYWLWTRPKNAVMFASRFGCCEKYVQGKYLWRWIGRIASLEKKKIVWDGSLDEKGMEIFAVTADGVDFPIWERKDANLPMDPKNMSHKFRGCGAKYVIVLSTHRSKCVHIAGPFRGGKGDIDILRDTGLMDKLERNNKVCIVDRGFKTKYVQEKKVLAYPDYIDSSELHNFKSRARCRQETFNRRLKHFESLSITFKNGFEKQGIAVRAVAVTVQYQMDNGSPLYDT